MPSDATNTMTKPYYLTTKRLQLSAWALFIFSGILLGLFIHENFLSSQAKDPHPYRDFIAFWAAGKLADEGRPEQAYDPVTMHAAEKAAVPNSEKFAWFYPPTYHMLVLPLSWISYKPAYASFMLLSIMLYYWTVRTLAPPKISSFAILAFPGVTVNVIFGQNAMITASLAMLALHFLPRRPALAGVFIGMLAMKPHMAIMFPLALLCGGYWRTFGTAAATTVLMVLASLTILGPKSWIAFIDSLQTARNLLELGGLPWSRMTSVFADSRLLGTSIHHAYIGHGVTAIIFMAGMVYVWLASHDIRLRGAALALATLTVSPYMYDYELMWLAIPILMLTLRGLEKGWLFLERELLILAWLFPLADLLLAPSTQASMAILLEGLLLVLTLLQVQRDRRTSSGSAENY